MGLTTREREPKPSFRAVQNMFRAAPYFPLTRYPKVSVVVASYNGERTLKACLDSLRRLNYPDYEIILVDDGSTDTTRQIAFLHPNVRYFRHEKNLGLSVARNTGIAAATGEIVAFTDADCRADEDWLYYLVGDLLDSEFAGIGGPNLLPPEDSPVAAAVMVSPGGPAHVMLTDRQAEHIPGCNMAFYKWALDAVGGFDPIFHQAGDDVDLCWRLQQAGYKIGFSPAAFVWHYRRSTVGGVPWTTATRLRRGRSAAGAQASGVLQLVWRQHLARAHLHRVQVWRAAAPADHLSRPVWQRGLPVPLRLRAGARPDALHHARISRAGHAAAVGPVGDLPSACCPLAITSLLISAGRLRGGRRAGRVAREQEAPVVASAGGAAVLPATDRARLGALQGPAAAASGAHRGPADAGLGRAAQGRQSLEKLNTGQRGSTGSPSWPNMLRRLEHRGWPNSSDIGWSDYDVEIYDTRWSKLQLTTVAEERGQLLRCRLRGALVLARQGRVLVARRAAIAALWADGLALALAGAADPAAPGLVAAPPATQPAEPHRRVSR